MNERTAEVLVTVDKVLEKVQAEGASDILILLKTNGVYSRFSTSIDDVTEVIAQLEMLKFDILQRMNR